MMMGRRSRPFWIRTKATNVAMHAVDTPQLSCYQRHATRMNAVDRITNKTVLNTVAFNSKTAVAVMRRTSSLVKSAHVFSAFSTTLIPIWAWHVRIDPQDWCLWHLKPRCCKVGIGDCWRSRNYGIRCWLWCLWWCDIRRAIYRNFFFPPWFLCCGCDCFCQ